MRKDDAFGWIDMSFGVCLFLFQVLAETSGGGFEKQVGGECSKAATGFEMIKYSEKQNSFVSLFGTCKSKSAHCNSKSTTLYQWVMRSVIWLSGGWPWGGLNSQLSKFKWLYVGTTTTDYHKGKALPGQLKTWYIYFIRSHIQNINWHRLVYILNAISERALSNSK